MAAPHGTSNGGAGTSNGGTGTSNGGAGTSNGGAGTSNGSFFGRVFLTKNKIYCVFLMVLSPKAWNLCFFNWLISSSASVLICGL